MAMVGIHKPKSFTLKCGDAPELVNYFGFDWLIKESGNQTTYYYIILYPQHELLSSSIIFSRI